jgi:hypothetical protein
MSEGQIETAEAPEAQYVRVGDRSTTVQLKNGTCAAAAPGSVWSTDQMRDSFVKQLATDASWSSHLFEPATKEEYDQYVVDSYVPEQKDFMRGHLREFGHVILPEPDRAPENVGTADSPTGAIVEAEGMQFDPDRKAPIADLEAEVPSEDEPEDGSEDDTTTDDDD